MEPKSFLKDYSAWDNITRQFEDYLKSVIQTKDSLYERSLALSQNQDKYEASQNEDQQASIVAEVLDSKSQLERCAAEFEQLEIQAAKVKSDMREVIVSMDKFLDDSSKSFCLPSDFSSDFEDVFTSSKSFGYDKCWKQLSEEVPIALLFEVAYMNKIKLDYKESKETLAQKISEKLILAKDQEFLKRPLASSKSQIDFTVVAGLSEADFTAGDNDGEPPKAYSGSAVRMFCRINKIDLNNCTSPADIALLIKRAKRKEEGKLRSRESDDDPGSQPPTKRFSSWMSASISKILGKIDEEKKQSTDQ